MIQLLKHICPSPPHPLFRWLQSMRYNAWHAFAKNNGQGKLQKMMIAMKSETETARCWSLILQHGHPAKRCTHILTVKCSLSVWNMYHTYTSNFYSLSSGCLIKNRTRVGDELNKILTNSGKVISCFAIHRKYKQTDVYSNTSQNSMQTNEHHKSHAWKKKQCTICMTIKRLLLRLLL